MAIWQLDLQIAPRLCALDRMKRRVASEIANAQVEAWWTQVTPDVGSEQRLASILPWHASWTDDWKVFGEEDGNRIDVMLSGGHMEQVRVRIDVRDVDFELLERLVDFAADYDCIFVNGSGHVIEPTVENVCIEIEASPAANFVEDPTRFLEHLRRCVWVPGDADSVQVTPREPLNCEPVSGIAPM